MASDEPEVALTSQSLQVAGAELEAAVWRPETAAPGETGERSIVLLHEGLGSVSAWGRFPSGLSATLAVPVHAYSREGYGRSTLRRPRFGVEYMHEEAACVPSVLEALGVSKPLVVGHSDGGSIALLLAGARPDLVSGLVLLAPHCFVEDFGLDGIRAAREDARSSDLIARLARHHNDALVVFQRWCDIWLDRSFRNWNIESALEAITVPILAIQGRDDRYGSLRHIEVIRKRATNAPWVDLLVLDGCGHAPHRERPLETFDAISVFAGRVWGQ